VFISDTGNDRIQRFDANGNFVVSWGANGTGPGDLIKPAQIQLDGTGNPWVADPFNNRIQRYTLSN
jgi:tripartite motif-containing protein 71